MEIRQLQQIGLTKAEAEIYLKLLEIGSCKAGRLAKETGYNRTTIYKAADTLLNHGLISYGIRENRKYFEPAPPENLLQDINNQKKELEEQKIEIAKALPGLNELFESNKEEFEANIYKGIKGVKAVFDNILNVLDRGDEYIVFGVPRLAEELMIGYFEEFIAETKKRGFASTVILDERAELTIKSCTEGGFDVYTLPPEYMSPAEVNIYKDEVAIVLWTAPLAIVIKGKGMAQSFLAYFEVLKKIAKNTTPDKRK